MRLSEMVRNSFALAVLALLATGCSSPRPVGFGNRLDFGDDRLQPLRAAALGEKVTFESPAPVELIAWAAKSTDGCPPLLVEEAIVRMPLSGGTTMSVVTRRSGESRWSLAHRVPGTLEPTRTYPSQPTDLEVGEFIKKTNFGYNEYDESIDVLHVELFVRSTHLLHILRAGIPKEQKWARASIFDERSRKEPH